MGFSLVAIQAYTTCSGYHIYSALETLFLSLLIKVTAYNVGYRVDYTELDCTSGRGALTCSSCSIGAGHVVMVLVLVFSVANYHLRIPNGTAILTSIKRFGIRFFIHKKFSIALASLDPVWHREIIWHLILLFHPPPIISYNYYYNY